MKSSDQDTMAANVEQGIVLDEPADSVSEARNLTANTEQGKCLDEPAGSICDASSSASVSRSSKVIDSSNDSFFDFEHCADGRLWAQVGDITAAADIAALIPSPNGAGEEDIDAAMHFYRADPDRRINLFGNGKAAAIRAGRGCFEVIGGHNLFEFTFYTRCDAPTRS